MNQLHRQASVPRSDEHRATLCHSFADLWFESIVLDRVFDKAAQISDIQLHRINPELHRPVLKALCSHDDSLLERILRSA